MRPTDDGDATQPTDTITAHVDLLLKPLLGRFLLRLLLRKLLLLARSSSTL